MPLSMTGYGRATVCRDGREMTVELKSVNHRFLDPAFKMPRVLAFCESAMRAQMSERLARGHIDVFVTYRNTRADARNVRLDEALLGAYLSALTQSERFGVKNDIAASDLLTIPDVLIVEEAAEDTDALSSLVSDALDGAITMLTDMRKKEGETLARDLNKKLDLLEDISRAVDARSPVWLEDYRKRLKARVEEISGTALDENRLTQEVALVADRTAVDEEMVRLRSHIAQLRALLAGSEPSGRKIDFLVQEMNREINTCGSKSVDAELTDMVVNAKAELEKIREQIQNLE